MVLRVVVTAADPSYASTDSQILPISQQPLPRISVKLHSSAYTMRRFLPLESSKKWQGKNTRGWYPPLGRPRVNILEPNSLLTQWLLGTLSPISKFPIIQLLKIKKPHTYYTERWCCQDCRIVRASSSPLRRRYTNLRFQQCPTIGRAIWASPTRHRQD